jgi:hypothetical protein
MTDGKAAIPTRQELGLPSSTRLRAGDSHRPRLLLMERAGRRIVVKDFLPCGWLVRSLVGPWLVRREERIYRLLEGCPGVPRLVGRVDRHALALEYIEGRNAGEYADGTLPPEFFARLQQVVDAMHARQVVHCDLKNRKNIVVADGYRPYLVDFSAAFTRAGALGWLRRRAYDRFALDDRRAVVKARLQVGQLWNQEDADFVFRRGALERMVRRVRDGLRWTFKLISRG